MSEKSVQSIAKVADYIDTNKEKLGIAVQEAEKTMNNLVQTIIAQLIM